MWDGNAICALIGDDLVVGCGGFGESVPAALRDLAACIDRDQLTVTVAGYRGPSIRAAGRVPSQVRRWLS